MKFQKVCLSFCAGDAPVSVQCETSGGSGALSWEILSDNDRFLLTLSSEKEVKLQSVEAVFSFDFQPDDRLFLNGYQSWTDSREHTVSDRLRDLSRVPRPVEKKFSFSRYGDYDFVSYGKKKGQLHGFSYAYIRRGEEYFLLGSRAEDSGFTVIRFDAPHRRVILQKECAGHHFKGAFTAFDLGLFRGGEDEVFDAYFARLGIAPCTAPRLVGYTSWYNRYENITEDSVLEDLDGFAASDQTPDVFQIDDGYETAVGDWLCVDEKKFPGGMKAIASRIRATGMIPGLWLAPFAAEKTSRLAAEHPDWLLRDEAGDPVPGGSNWSGFWGLDIYNEGVREYVKTVFDTVLHEWGYGFVKLDFLYAACLVPRRDKTRGRVMRDAMEFLRTLCGDTPILGCGVPLASAFGLVEYCRIGCDVSLSWDDAWYMRFFHRERPSTKNTVFNTVFRRQLDGRAFRCDPDVFLLRDDNIKLSDPQKEILATVNALFGGVLFTSDNIGAYTGKAKERFDALSSLSQKSLERLEWGKDGLYVFWRADEALKSLFIPL